MPNRVLAMIASYETQIADRLAKGLVTQEKIDDLRKSLDMPFEDYVNFQELKSLASTDGTLTLEEAQTIYGFLGETPDVFNGQPVAVKSVLTKVHHELLERAIRQRRSMRV